MLKIVYIGFGFDHHKKTHAGYQQIKEFLKYDYEINCQLFYEKRYKRGSIIERCFRKTLSLLINTRAFPWHIMKCIWKGLWNDNLTFHFVYGENLYFPFRKFIRKNNKIVCTLHQPFNWFIENEWEEKLKSLDGVILVGNSEIHKFECLIGADKVKFIPHGIRSDYYTMNLKIEKELLVLTVGNWLRDYKFANQVYKKLVKYDSRIKIVVVSKPSNRHLIDENENVLFLCNIEDDELRELYQKSSVLFLPLVRYTANNSLLEAGGCGCNIVIASNYPDNSYIPKDYIALVGMDVNEAFNSIIKVCRPVYNKSLSDLVKNTYSWNLIADKTRNFICSINSVQSNISDY